jgi:hypothetical protein
MRLFTEVDATGWHFYRSQRDWIKRNFLSALEQPCFSRALFCSVAATFVESHPLLEITTASESRTAVTPSKASMKWITIEYRFHLSSKGGIDSPVIQV